MIYIVTKTHAERGMVFPGLEERGWLQIVPYPVSLSRVSLTQESTMIHQRNHMRMPEVSLGVKWFSILSTQSCSAPLGAAQTLYPFHLSTHAVYTLLCFTAFSVLPGQLAQCHRVCVPGSLSDLPITPKPNSSAVKEVAMFKHSRVGYPWYQVPVPYSTQGKM